MGAYADYLHLDRLLSLQQPRTSVLPAELAFIIAHQVYELWFKLIITDLEQGIVALDVDDVGLALRCLRRMNSVERLMFEQLRLLEHMDPCEFAEIRKSLGSASAAESRQYALIESLSTCTLTDTMRSSPGRDLWSSFSDLLRRSGLPMPPDSSDSAYRIRLNSLHLIYEGGGTPNGEPPTSGFLSDVCEALLDHDEAFLLWRHRHYLTAARHIGQSSGTGGTSGIKYLERRLTRRFYPDLWDVRTSLVSGKPRVGKETLLGGDKFRASEA
jgi:tryptophan 2,3-dioxygenase